MEDITNYEVLYHETKKKLDDALLKLEEAREDIRDLNEEINTMTHEDEVIIKAKNKIRNLSVSFEGR